MATTCPENENATDCLLRALLLFTEDEAHAQDSKFDWGPITFAFTVPIGLLAAVFALITICQAVLASGPGRRKSSSRTIGKKWASKTTKEWNWHDFNVVSIAQTPVMRARRIQEVLEELLLKEQHQKPEKSLDVPEKMLQENPSRPDASPASSIIKRPKGSPAATWLRLLQHLGLQDLDLEDDDLEVTAADYLPDDILAVPAYADLGFIIAVAAAAGAHSFRSDSKSIYPVIIGDGFQFDFRQHPSLGNVGAFSKYGREKSTVRPPTTQQIVLALRHSRGDIDIGPSFLSGSTNALEKDQKEGLNIFFPFEPATILQTFTSHECKHHSTLYKAALGLSWSGVPDEYHLLWLFVAKSPEDIPATFPSKQSNFSNVLQMIALNSPFWSSPNESEWNDKERLTSFYGKSSRNISKRISPESPTGNELKELSKVLLLDRMGKETEGWDYDRVYLSRGFEVNAWRASKHMPTLYEHVCEASAKFLYRLEDFMTWFNAMIQTRKRYFRLLVLLQLQDIDRQLERANKKGAVSCRIFSLYYTTLALLNSEHAINDNSFGVSKSHNGQKSSWGVLNVDDGPQNNLIVRRFTTLKSLGSFFDTVDPISLFRHYQSPNYQLDRVKLFCIFKTQLDLFGKLNSNLVWKSRVLRHMKTILDSCYNTISKSDWIRRPVQGVNDAKIHDQPGKVREQTEEENNSSVGGEKLDRWKRLDELCESLEPPIMPLPGKDQCQGLKQEEQQDAANTPEEEWELERIDNLIIFRSILLCLLFCTAPDSSDMLSSGIWEHVIPII